MSDLTVIVYGNADLYRECFNAIASIFGSSWFQTLFRLSTLLAFVTVMFSFTMRQDMTQVFRWFALVYIVCYVLFVPKVTLYIEDRVNNGSTLAVDHVPFGLAVMASYTSVIGDALTKNIEATFTLPDDLRYQRTGMVMASRLVMAANHFEITDAKFNRDMMEFTHRCIFYDLLLHRYTSDQLLRAPNTWEFIKTNTSVANAFALDGDVVSCRDGAKMLSQNWNAIIDQVAKEYGARLFPQSASADTELKSRLVTSYRYLLNNISANSETIFTQHLIKNAIERGVIHMDGSLDAQAALQTYAITRGNDQLRATIYSVGELAGEWIVYIKNAIEIIAYAMFIFVVLLAVFPSGNYIIKNYFMILLWLQLWAPLYAIINMIVTFYAKSNTASVGGLTLHTMSAILDSNRDMAGIAGYMTFMVPMLSWKMVNGMNGMFEHVAHGFNGVMQSAIATGVSEATSGNFSFGNTSFANHSSDNRSQFKWDSSGRFTSGLMQTQLADGSTMTNTPSGQAVVDRRGVISNLGTQVDFSGALRESMSKQAEKSTQHALSQSVEAAQSYIEAQKDLYQFDALKSKHEASGESWATHFSAGESSSYRQAMQKTQRFADDNRISFGEAAKVLSVAHAEVRAAAQQGFKIPLTKIGASVTESGGGGRVSDRSSHVDHSSLYDKAKSFVQDSGYAENMDAAIRSTRDHSYRTNNDEANRLLDSTSVAYDKAESHRASAQHSLQEAKSYRESANHSEEIANTYRVDMGQQLAEYIAHQPHPSGDGAITYERIGDVANDAGLMKRYVDQFIDQSEQFHLRVGHGIPGSAHQVRSEFDRGKSVVKEDSLSQAYENDKMKFEGKVQGRWGGFEVDTSRKSMVDDDIAQKRGLLESDKSNLKHEGDNAAREYEREHAKKRASDYATENLVKGIDTERGGG